MEDLALAQRLRPHAAVMVINGASVLTPADYVCSLSKESLLQAACEQMERFDRKVTSHLPYPPLGRRVNHLYSEGEPVEEDQGFASHIWPGTQSGATSSWCGVRILKRMGYTEIILCGVPLDHPGYAQIDTWRKPDRVESWADPNASRNANYRLRLTDYIAEGEGEGVFSMSGYTREKLGYPQEQST